MNHEEARRLIPRYAAGELNKVDADAVRGHLASGCADCLADVFQRPVGLPRAPRRVNQTPARPETRVRSGQGRRMILSGLLALGVAGAGALALWTFARLRRIEGGARIDTARLDELERTRSVLASRVEQLDEERARAGAEALRQAEAARTAADTSANLRRELDTARARIAALPRGVPPPADEVDRLLGSVDAQRVLQELMALPGVELLRMVAIAPYLGVSGHVLWHPARADAVVCAFHLPRLSGGALYRVRVVLEDGKVEEGPAFRPAAAGDIVLPVRLQSSVDRLRAVELVRDPGAVPVLTGQVAPPGE